MRDDSAQPADPAVSLPPVFQGLLDNDQLQQIFTDLKACAQVLHVQVRSAGAPRADRHASLDEVFQLLQAGQIRSAQIRYRYQDDVWCDTLLAKSDGVRLVRIQQDEGAAGPEEDSLKQQSL